MNSNKRRAVGYYLLGIILSLVILWITCLPLGFRLHLPIAYSGDSIGVLEMIKGLIDGEWYPFGGIHSDRLAAPFGFNMNDFPMSDNLFFVIIKVLSFFSKNVFRVVNSYFLLTFVFSTVAFMYLLRQNRVSYPTSIVFSLLFSFLPYHFYRGIYHLFLASYFMIPLLILILTWLWSEKPLFFTQHSNNSGYKLDLFNNRALFSYIVVFLSGSGGIYYAFFFAFFAVVAGFHAAYARKKYFPLYSAGILVFVVSVAVFVNILPGKIANYSNGINSEIGNRNFTEAEVFGLKITQLLLPVDNHRIESFAELKQQYNQLAPLVNENSYATLGLIGSAGFITLLLVLISDRRDTAYHVSVLNAAGVLLATLGGGAVLFALFVSPSIRAYNRISIYLAAFSFFALAILFDQVSTKFKTWWRYAFLAVFLALGIFDQTTLGMQFTQSKKSEYFSDKQFITDIEHAEPANAMIWQMPFMPFPENGPILKMEDYSHFKGYLHSSSLKWSYGAMPGRYPYYWMQRISSLPIDQMVRKLSLAGFAGIYIDRFGYKDPMNEVELPLQNILRVTPMVSENARLVFFDMSAYNRQQETAYGSQRDERRKAEFNDPPISLWHDCSSLEGAADNSWRWCGRKGRIVFINTTDDVKTGLLKATFATGYMESSILQIKSKQFLDKIAVNATGTHYEKSITLAPRSEFSVEYSSDAKRLEAPGDPRYLVFKIINFTAEY